jgi:hypothetical protein
MSTMTTTFSKGKYQAKILAQGYEKSRANETPYFYLQLLIMFRYGADGALQQCPQLERTYKQYVNTEQGVIIFREHLKAWKIDIAGLEQLDPDVPTHLNLVNRTIDVGCDFEHYEGKQRERWGPPRGGTKLGQDALRALNDKFGHLFRGNGTTPPPPPVTKPNESDTAF